VIRRLFWLTLGAVLGVTGYRRLTAAIKSVSPRHQLQGLAGFTDDVREGMALYMERHPDRSALTLEDQTARPELPAARGRGRRRTDDLKDGR
jgi:hypothetical protein